MAAVADSEVAMQKWSQLTSRLQRHTLRPQFEGLACLVSLNLGVLPHVVFLQS